MIKSGDISFVLDALRVAKQFIEEPDTMEEYEVIDQVCQAIDCIMKIEDGAREEGVIT